MTYPYKTYQVALPDNCNIAYIDEGKGEQTLLFIHGLANYAMVWRKNIDYLRQYYRCIAIDLPGNGLSDRNEHSFDLNFFAECICNFIRALDLRNVTIVGHSMGGQTAILTVVNYPGCAERLILCAPAGFEEFSSFDKKLFYGTIHMRDLLSSDEHLLRSTIESSFFKQHTQGESVIKELIELMKTYKPGYYRKMVEGCIRGMLENTVIEVLHLIKQPTLILFGLQDALIPNKLLHHTTTEKVATEGTAKIPNARLELLPNCGHFLQWEKADEVNREIMLFMEQKITRIV